MSEAHDVRLKRLNMRSSRRGIREMDMILGAYARSALESMPPEKLDLYEALLDENDQDLLAWVTGLQPAPRKFAILIDEVATALQDARRRS